MKKFICVFLLFCIFSLIACELFLRWFYPVYFCNTISQYQYDKNLGVTTKPNLEKSILTDHIIEVFTNDIGSRNYLDKDDLLKYKKIIFCVGDSYTEGTGNAVDQSYPFYLSLLLNRNKDSGLHEKNYAVINLGLGDYGSIQSYIVSKVYMEKLGRKPYAIIYFICANDPDDDILFKNGYKHRYVVLGSPYYNRVFIVLNEVLENIQLFKRIKLLSGPIVHKKSVSNEHILKKALSQENRLVTREFDPGSLPGLIDLVGFCKENNIKLFISYTDFKSAEYDMLKKFATDNKVGFADYRPDVESVKTAIPRIPVFNWHSGGHFRSWVNFIIASKFVPLVEKEQNNP